VRVAVVGGGPAGLYLAWLLKRRDLSTNVTVFEQNPRGATYGWGLVFSARALSFLEAASPEISADIAARSRHWDDQVIVHRGRAVHIDGLSFSGIGRLALLEVLQAHCERAGVEMRFDTRLEAPPSRDLYDLVVGADGVNSVVRQAFVDAFQPNSQMLTNRYVWYGTHQLFHALTLTFREHRDGVFVAHHYPHSDTTSTFVVECDASTFQRAGLAGMNEAESRRYCEEVFAEDLGGHALLTNRSLWITYRVVTNQRWSVPQRNVVLIGDALRTVHFSIGSGTRSGMEDAIALDQALAEHPNTALEAFEMARRPEVEKFLQIAQSSYTWYEQFREKLRLSPIQLAYDYVQRSGRISHERLKARSPAFAAAYEAFLAGETAR
jgi:2-polyprenyl-6-methoxyphenol hydroxylase-like FAD-dependent oxidoreductase